MSIPASLAAEARGHLRIAVAIAGDLDQAMARSDLASARVLAASLAEATGKADRAARSAAAILGEPETEREARRG